MKQSYSILLLLRLFTVCFTELSLIAAILIASILHDLQKNNFSLSVNHWFYQVLSCKKINK